MQVVKVCTGSNVDAGSVRYMQVVKYVQVVMYMQVVSGTCRW